MTILPRVPRMSRNFPVRSVRTTFHRKGGDTREPTGHDRFRRLLLLFRSVAGAGAGTGTDYPWVPPWGGRRVVAPGQRSPGPGPVRVPALFYIPESIKRAKEGQRDEVHVERFDRGPSGRSDAYRWPHLPTRLQHREPHRRRRLRDPAVGNRVINPSRQEIRRARRSRRGASRRVGRGP